MYPGTVAGCALPLAHGGFAHDEILSSCRRGTCSDVTFSSGLPRRLAVVCFGLGWDGMGCGSCGRETRRLFGRRVSADGQSSSLRRRSTPARFLSALNNRRTPVGPAGLQSANLTSTRACKPYGSTHLGAVQHNGRNRCSVVVRRKKGTRAANGSAGPADQTKRQLHHFFGAAGVVVPTSLPKLLYRKLHPRAVKRR